MLSVVPTGSAVALARLCLHPPLSSVLFGACLLAHSTLHKTTGFSSQLHCQAQKGHLTVLSIGGI